MRNLLGLMLPLLLLSCGHYNDWTQTPGPAGAKGDTGAAGANGQNGVSCEVTVVGISSIAPNGGALISCPNSSSLVLNGANGTNGTVVSSKTLCPGTPSYPSVFIEVAFCVDNNLYAVYSANGGFMTELPPGAYASNAVGSACSFNVTNNCGIEN